SSLKRAPLRARTLSDCRLYQQAENNTAGGYGSSHHQFLFSVFHSSASDHRRDRNGVRSLKTGADTSSVKFQNVDAVFEVRKFARTVRSKDKATVSATKRETPPEPNCAGGVFRAATPLPRLILRGPRRWSLIGLCYRAREACTTCLLRPQRTHKHR